MIKKLVVLLLCIACGMSVLHAEDVSYTTVHATAIDGAGKSGLVNAMVGPGQDTTEVLLSMKALRISGTLNSSDCMILRNKMPNLKHLDMTDVEFVEGGNAYYGSNKVKAGIFPVQLFYQSVLSDSLRSVDLPNSITQIGTQAFYACSQLQRVSLGENLTTVGTTVFYYCTKLASITFGEKVETIGGSAFYNCQSLTEVSLPSSLKKLDGSCFSNCSKLASITIPDQVNSIGTNCFSGCVSAGSITLGSSVREIPSGCFSNCYAVSTVNFNGHETTIGASAFLSCRSLTDITLPETLKTIGASAFAGCSGLTSVRLPLSLTSLGSGAFNLCSSLKELHVPFVTPLEIASGTFSSGSGGVYSKVTLYVPTISYYPYFWHNVWGAFLNIRPEQYQYEPLELTQHCVISPKMPGFTAGAYNQLGYWVQQFKIQPTGSLCVEAGASQAANRLYVISNETQHPSLINHGSIPIEHLHMQLPVKGGEWRLITFPRNIARSSVSGLPSSADIREYNGAGRAATGEGWSAFSGTTFEVGKGYAIFVNANANLSITIDGKYNNMTEADTDISLNTNASGTAANAGWNLLGNPYLSYYDIADLGISDPVVVYNAQHGRYETYYPAEEHYLLSPYEAFFVKKNSSSTVSFRLAKRQVYSRMASSALPSTVHQTSAAGTNPPEPAVMSMVSVACEPATEGTITGGGIYAIGSTPTIQVTPNPGFQVDHWTLNGNYYAGPLSQITYTVTATNASLVAVMGERTTVDPGYNPDMPDDPDPQATQSSQVTLRFKVSPTGTAKFRVNGQLLGSSNEILVDASSLAHIKCEPNTNFTFNGWYLNGTRISTEAECDYMMYNRNITLLASVKYSPKNPNDPTVTEAEAENNDVDKGQGILLGDVNDDGTVDVSDAVKLVNYLGDSNTDPELLIPLRCDMNLDNNVDLKDADAIVEAYLERTRFTQADTVARHDTIADALSISAITLEPGGDAVSLQVELTTSTSYAAFAFDLLLPEGIEADTSKLVSPASSHQLKYQLLLDGGQVLRVACYNKTGNVLPTSLKILLRLPLSSPPYTFPSDQGVVGVRHATLINKQAQSFVPTCGSTNITISEHTHIPLVISETNKYNTLILPFGAQLPAGLRAAEVRNGNDTCVYLTEVQVLEPFTPYIVYAPNGINTVLVGDYLTPQYLSSATVGYLTGVLVNTTINEGYVLQNHGNGAAFYMVINDVILPAGKAFMNRSDGSDGSNSIALYHYNPGAEGEGTDLGRDVPIEDVGTGSCFDYRGMRVAYPSQPGFYLSSGRKIFIGK